MDKVIRLVRLKNRCRTLLSEVYRGQEKIVVFGEGNANARVMLIGEAPGEQETVQQRPFVGKAGQNLDAFLQMVDMKREDLYITNVVKFRPTKAHPATGRLSNRTPDREEVGLCFPFLMQEIAIVRPDVLVTLGNTALHAILDQTVPTIGEMHGVPYPWKRDRIHAVLFPLYHPASIIYRRDLAKTYEDDVQGLAEYLRQNGILGK